jgi:hypothetical protein
MLISIIYRFFIQEYLKFKLKKKEKIKRGLKAFPAALLWRKISVNPDHLPG